MKCIKMNVQACEAKPGKKLNMNMQTCNDCRSKQICPYYYSGRWTLGTKMKVFGIPCLNIQS